MTRLPVDADRMFAKWMSGFSLNAAVCQVPVMLNTPSPLTKSWFAVSFGSPLTSLLK